MVTLSRLGRKRRLVLMLEWLTLCPTCAVLPVSSHRHDIEKPYPSKRLPDRASAHCQRLHHLRLRRRADLLKAHEKASKPVARGGRGPEGRRIRRRLPIPLSSANWTPR